MFSWHLQTTASYFMKKNRHSWRIKNSIFNFVNWYAYKEEFKENACKSKQYKVENSPALPGLNWISTWNRRVKSVPPGRAEILSQQAGIM